jgi:hypothetical protein
LRACAPERIPEVEEDTFSSMQSDPQLTRLLARAFDRAWDRYYRPGRVTIAPEVARPALANHLVDMAKDGTFDEGALAAGGLLHLISLTPEESPVGVHEVSSRSPPRSS